MKKAFIVLACMFLCSCGSAAEIAAALNATPVPNAAQGPNGETAATPTALPVRGDVLVDYAKIKRGMKREEIVSKLGEPTKARFETFCNNGECREYEYLSYLYDEKTIGITIEAGVATFTYVM
jgi:hypothetical protein